MFDNYAIYPIFFIANLFIFAIIGLILRLYTGRDWFSYLTRIIVILVMVGITTLRFIDQNETIERLIDSIMLIVNILLYVVIPLIIGELISARTYKLI